MAALRTIRTAHKPRVCARRREHKIEPGDLYVRVTYPPEGLIEQWQGSTLGLTCAVNGAPTREEAT
jgi:hypothetical protein